MIYYPSCLVVCYITARALMQLSYMYNLQLCNILYKINAFYVCFMYYSSLLFSSKSNINWISKLNSLGLSTSSNYLVTYGRSRTKG